MVFCRTLFVGFFLFVLAIVLSVLLQMAVSDYLSFVTLMSIFFLMAIMLFFLSYHGYVPLVVSTSQSFPHSRLVTGFVTRLTRRVPLVEQELPALPEHLSSLPDLVGFVLLDL